MTSHFNHQIDITAEFTLKNGTECIYISVNYLNYQSRLVQIIVEFTLKNGAKCIYILVNSQNYQNGLVQMQNKHHSWIHIEKQVLDIYNTYISYNS